MLLSNGVDLLIREPVRLDHAQRQMKIERASLKGSDELLCYSRWPADSVLRNLNALEAIVCRQFLQIARDPILPEKQRIYHFRRDLTRFCLLVNLPENLFEYLRGLDCPDLNLDEVTLLLVLEK